MSPSTPSRSHGLFVVFMFLLGMATVYFAMRGEHLAVQEAMESTVSAQFERHGNAYQAQGHLADSSQIAAQVKATLGPELLREIKRQGGVIVSTVTASGTVPASASPRQIVPMEPTFAGWNGTVKQDRGGLPPLTKANIAVSPTFETSVYWTNFEEKFNASVGEWRTGAGGLRAALRVSRTVAGVVEEIPLMGADATFPSSEVARLAPIPKVTFHLGSGVAHDRIYPVFLVSKHLTRNFQITTGYGNGGAMLLGSYSWGTQ